ncbi:SDR family NAD(P)-dependent oxidoreductase [Corynebacterium lubricantis]|uniref:SDR family NAD(P)-dependent oxidoreductase n=1 Tax=Corynebacterium lubricantis TaxID=541095 RepID=UPI00036832AC|nr:SDR family NAD(P)-dependent oxidoreductase [Corynebacterium lubricantis]
MNSPLLNENISAIVTGAASGLGAATAKRLADAGVKVVGFDLAPSIEKAHAAGSTTAGVTYLDIDVTDPDSVAAGVHAAAELGELRIAVNCAGIATTMRIVGRKGPHDLDVFNRVLNVNVSGTFNVLTAVANEMSTLAPLDDEQRGVILMTASVAAFEGQVGQAAYAASKGAIHSLAITAARDLGSLGIRVNAIAPGIVETPMMAGVSEEYRTELESNVVFPKRMAYPAEYAQLVQALVENVYLNGETIRLDGGLRMPPR